MRSLVVSILSLLWLSQYSSALCQNSLLNTELPDAYLDKPAINGQSHSKTHFLPLWFFDNSQNNDSTIIVFGISDPGLPSYLAQHQALIRAKALLSLMLNVDMKTGIISYENSIENISNNSNLAVQSKFTRLLECKSNACLNHETLTVLDSTTTIYGEKILKLAYSPDYLVNNKNTHNCTVASLDLYHAEYGVNENFLNNGLLCCKIWENDVLLQYKSYQQAPGSQTFSFYNDTLLSFKVDYYRYFSPVNDTADNLLIATSLYNGLWKAYIENVGYQLLNISSFDVTSVSQVSDAFTELSNGQEKSFKSNALASHFNSSKLSFRLQKIYISGNELKIHLHFNQQSLLYEK